MVRVYLWIVFLACSFPITIFAQTVSNVRAFNEDGTIMVIYDLFTAKSEKQFFIKLYYSTDKGQTYMEATSATGDVNRNVKAGNDLSAIWKPTITSISDLIFKVEALPKYVKAYAKAVADGLELMSVNRKAGNKLELNFSITNNSTAPLDIKVIQFLIRDNKESNFSNAAMTSKSWPETGIPGGANGQFILEVKNVTAASTAITRIILLSGGKTFTFENISVKIEEEQ